MYAQPPMKIIISVKWSSLGREEEAVGDTDQEWLYRISRAAKLRTVRESCSSVRGCGSIDRATRFHCVILRTDERPERRPPMKLRSFVSLHESGMTSEHYSPAPAKLINRAEIESYDTPSGASTCDAREEKRATTSPN